MEKKAGWVVFAKYFSLNGNYINNFGIYSFSDNEIDFIINEENKNIPGI